MKNNDKSVAFKDREQRRAAAQAKEMRLMYKFIFATCMAILGVLAVLTIKKNGDITVAFLTKAQLPIVAVCAFLTLVAAVYFILQKKRKADESSRVVTSTGLFAVALGALALFASYNNYLGLEYDTARIVTVIVLAVLYFVYHIYDATFFTISVQCALGVLAVSVLSKTSISMGIRATGAIVAVVLCTVGAYILLWLLSGKESAAVKDYKFYIMTAIVIAGVLLSLIIPAIITYAMFAILAVYVVNAVISTIELM